MKRSSDDGFMGAVVIGFLLALVIVIFPYLK